MYYSLCMPPGWAALYTRPLMSATPPPFQNIFLHHFTPTKFHFWTGTAILGFYDSIRDFQIATRAAIIKFNVVIIDCLTFFLYVLCIVLKPYTSKETNSLYISCICTLAIHHRSISNTGMHLACYLTCMNIHSLHIDLWAGSSEQHLVAFLR